MLLKKLDKTTILDYETKLSNVKEMQTLSSFLKYLESRFLALSSAKDSGEKLNEKIKSTFGSTKNNEKRKRVQMHVLWQASFNL